MEVVTINILVKLQPLVEVNRLVRRSVLLLPDEQDESEEARKTSKKIKNEIVILLFFSLKRNLHDLWKIKMRPYLTEFHLKIVVVRLFGYTPRKLSAVKNGV